MTPAVNLRGSQVMVSGLHKIGTWEGRVELVAVLLLSHDWCPRTALSIAAIGHAFINPREGARIAPEIQAQAP